MTGSAEFQAWFAGSKVTRKGKPLVVHHGTPRNFTHFDSDHWNSNADGGPDEIGFYFTSRATYAKRYATGDNARMITAYLRTVNPYIVTGIQWGRGDGLSPKEARDQGYDGYIVHPYEEGDMFIVWENDQIWQIKT